MGWWKVQGADTCIGDEPLDALLIARDSVTQAYLSAFGRRPTRAEWEALLYATLTAQRPERAVLDSGTVTGVELEVASK